MVPFRQAGSAYGRPPLCTFFLPLARSAGGGEDGDKETAGAGKNHSVPADKNSNEALIGQTRGGAIKSWVRAVGREYSGGVNGADRREGGLGRAFGHPAADSSPAATHVVNFIEDNADLVWSSFALRGPDERGQRDVQHPRRAEGSDREESAHDKPPTAHESEAGRRSTKGKQRRSSADDDDDGEENAGKGAARMHSKRRGGEDRVGGTETAEAGAPAVGVTVVEGERLLEQATAPLKPTAAVLPDIVGAGGFAEFIPLLDTVFGR